MTPSARRYRTRVSHDDNEPLRGRESDLEVKWESAEMSMPATADTLARPTRQSRSCEALEATSLALCLSMILLRCYLLVSCLVGKRGQRDGDDRVLGSSRVKQSRCGGDAVESGITTAAVEPTKHQPLFRRILWGEAHSAHLGTPRVYRLVGSLEFLGIYQRTEEVKTNLGRPPLRPLKKSP